MTLTNPTQLRVLGAAVAALFAAGVFGLVSESGDDGDELGTSAPTTSSSSSSSLLPSTSIGSATTAPLSPTTSVLPTVTSEATTSTTTGGGGGSVNVAGGSGLGAGGSAAVNGSGQMADTGAEDYFLPGALLLGAALGGRRLLASARD